MAVRTSLAALITRVRQLIYDPAGAAQVFSDQQVQDALDVRRADLRYASLRAAPTFQPGGQITYLDYFSEGSAWEDDYQLTDLSYTVITPTVTVYEPLVGHWQLSVQPNGVAVRITGKIFDLYGCAADLLDEWAVSLKLSAYRITSDDQTFHRETLIPALISLAARYRALAWPDTMRLETSDQAAQDEGEAVTFPTRAGGGGYA